MKRLPDSSWQEGAEDDIEELIAELELEFGYSVFADEFEVSIVTQSRTEFVEVDALGRKTFVVIDDDTGQEYREMFPTRLS